MIYFQNKWNLLFPHPKKKKKERKKEKKGALRSMTFVFLQFNDIHILSYLVDYIYILTAA
jgi:hypothetical protein